MISGNKVKDFVKKESDKKIGNMAVKKFNNILEMYAKKIIINASRRADFSGRIVIKEEDFEEI